MLWIYCYLITGSVIKTLSGSEEGSFNVYLTFLDISMSSKSSIFRRKMKNTFKMWYEKIGFQMLKVRGACMQIYNYTIKLHTFKLFALLIWYGGTWYVCFDNIVMFFKITLLYRTSKYPAHIRSLGKSANISDTSYKKCK